VKVKSDGIAHAFDKGRKGGGFGIDVQAVDSRKGLIVG